jgi:formylglycine-generating enzyme required for sulfatase activity
MKPTHLITLILCLIYTATQAQEVCGNEDFVRLHKQGLAQYAKKQYAEAIESLELANRYCPKCPDCKAMVAACRTALKKAKQDQTKAEADRIAREKQATVDKAQLIRDKEKAERIAKAKDIENAMLKQQLAEAKKPKPVIEKPKPDTENPPQPTTPTNGQVKEIAHGIKLVYVQGGSFMMGSNKGDANAKDNEMVNGKKHQETVSGFWIGQTEVTQAQWRAVMGKLYDADCDKCPVDNVSWNDVQQFLKKLNTRTGKTYRLPTEAEWEYAARGGTDWDDNYLYAGSNDIGNVAWYDGNYKNSKHGTPGTTHAVATQAARNQLGLYDMTGNVCEWCANWYKGYPSSSGVSDYTNSHRVIRGGSWFDRPQYSGVAYRDFQNPAVRDICIGFRLAFSQ